MSDPSSDQRLAQRARTEALRDQAVVLLRDKTAEEFLEYFLELSQLDLITYNGPGMAFTEACDKLAEEDPGRNFAYGLLLARHDLAKVRIYSYRILSPEMENNPEAEEIVLGLLDDPDQDVAHETRIRLEEDLESAKGTFEQLMRRVRRINIAKKRHKQ